MEGISCLPVQQVNSPDIQVPLQEPGCFFYSTSSFCQSSRISSPDSSNSASLPSASTLPSLITMIWSARRRTGRRWETTRQVCPSRAKVRSQSWRPVSHLHHGRWGLQIGDIIQRIFSRTLPVQSVTANYFQESKKCQSKLVLTDLAALAVRY
jgi:hypothetical protein